MPGNLDQLRPLHEAGVVGFKCFLLDSGVPEFPPLDDAGLRAALAELAAFDGLLIAHAEDADVIAAAPEPAGPSYAGFLASRPGAAEETAIGRLVAAARDTGARAHVVHLADADALPMLRQARAEGVRITVETCPHYLTFAAEQVPDGATAFKCCPPIREAAHREALWAALRDGDIDLVVSDHSPCTPELKRLDVGDFGAGLGRDRRRCRWRCRRSGPAPAQRGIGAGPTSSGGWPRRRPGWPACRARARSRSGRDADLVAFAPDERCTVGDLQHRNPVTPYAGRELTGVVRRTWLRGQLADGAPIGRLLRPRHARVTAPSTDPRSPMSDFTRLPDLASPCPRRRRRRRQRRVLRGARRTSCCPEPPVARTEFGHKGKEYDGWETRRRRTPGPRLGGRPARRARASWPASSSTPRSSPATTRRAPRSTAPRSRGTRRSTSCSRPTGSRCCRCPTWPATPPTPSPVDSDRRVTHVRLNIHPDGGVARLRVHGTVAARPAAARRRAVRPGRAGERRRR